MEDYVFEKNKLKHLLGSTYDVLKKYNCYIAGGAVLSIFTNKEINDFDVYFRSKQDLSDFLHNECEGNWIISCTKKSFTLKISGNVIQAIYFKFFASAKKLFETFDFTVCMAAYDFKTESFVLHKDFLKHNVAKILKFNEKTAYPIISALRVDKYKNKGFTISKAEFIRIILTISNMKITNIEELKEQIGGMYGECYDNLLSEESEKDFDLTNIVTKLADLSNSEKYFEQTNLDFKTNMEIGNWDIFVSNILGEKMVCFEINGRTVIRAGNEYICDVINDSDMKGITQIPVEQAIPMPTKCYKWVNKKNDGTYKSFWDTTYTWVIGINYPHGGGLYACFANAVANTGYYYETGKCLLEIEITDISDIKDFHSDYLILKKANVLREVPKDEWKNINKDIPLDEQNALSLW